MSSKIDINDIINFPGFIEQGTAQGISEDQAPFWYLFTALFPNANVESFNNILNDFYTSSNSILYSSTVEQQNFINLLVSDEKTNIRESNNLDLTNISNYSLANGVSPYDLSIQEYLRTSYIINANNSLEKQIRALLNNTEFIENTSNIIGQIAGQYNNKGGGIDGSDIYLQTDEDGMKFKLFVPSNLSDGSVIPPSKTVASVSTNDNGYTVISATGHGFNTGDVVAFNGSDSTYFEEKFFKITKVDDNSFLISNTGAFVTPEQVKSTNLNGVTIVPKLYQLPPINENPGVSLSIDNALLDNSNSFNFPKPTGYWFNDNTSNPLAWEKPTTIAERDYSFVNLIDPKNLFHSGTAPLKLIVDTINDDGSAVLITKPSQLYWSYPNSKLYSTDLNGWITLEEIQSGYKIFDGSNNEVAIPRNAEDFQDLINAVNNPFVFRKISRIVTESEINYLATHNTSICIDLLRVTGNVHVYTNSDAVATPRSIEFFDNSSDPSYKFKLENANSTLTGGQIIQLTGTDLPEFLKQEMVVQDVDSTGFKLAIKNDYNGLQAGRFITEGMLKYNNLLETNLSISSIKTGNSNLTVYDSINSSVEDAKKLGAALNSSNDIYAGLNTLKEKLNNIIANLSDIPGTESLLSSLTSLQDSMSSNATLNEWIAWQQTGSQESFIQNSMSAVTNLNEEYNFSIRKMMYSMDQFYNSANTVVRKIHSILRSFAKHIER